MSHKLVLRLLDAEDRLLGWAEVSAVAKGDGALWAPGPEVTLECEAEGIPAVLSIHWCDLNVETRVPAPSPDPVTVGTRVTAQYHDAPILRLGYPPPCLAPVTMRRAQMVTVPTAAMGLVGKVH